VNERRGKGGVRCQDRGRCLHSAGLENSALHLSVVQDICSHHMYLETRDRAS
jgi:hypothetical protein